jgi:enoyl-CoA hydratase
MLVHTVGSLAVLRLSGGKANSLTPALLDDLDLHLAEILASDAAAVVLTGEGRFFSAGLALPALVDLQRGAMRTFMGVFSTVMVRLFAADRPVIAAINGHAIAGGYVLALQCDERIAAGGDYRIGLNEVQLGIGLPASVVEPLRLAVPPSSFGPVALEGGLFKPEVARALGLVHEVVPAPELEQRAMERAEQLAAIPRRAYAQAKAAFRRPALEAIALLEESERERWLDTWFSEPAQARLQAAVAKLR